MFVPVGAGHRFFSDVLLLFRIAPAVSSGGGGHCRWLLRIGRHVVVLLKRRLRVRRVKEEIDKGRGGGYL